MKLFTLTLLVFFTSLSMLAQNTYIAHRGASFLAPENTLASAKLGWELGADAVEIDVHLSDDNRVMVIHDYDTKKTSLGKSNYKIAKTSSDLLRTVDVGAFKSEEYAGEKIPFIEEILEAIPPGKSLVIEIKCGSEILPALKEAIDESGKLDQLVFISFGWKTIVETHKLFPENKTYYLRMNPLGVFRKIRQAKKEGLTGMNLYHKIINEKVMEVSNLNNLEVLAWTVDDPETAKKLDHLGVNSFTTNRPAWLKAQMKE